MNSLVSINETESRMIDVMRGSLYPGAKPESISMVLGYCKARSLDPMRKPVHIVPMWVKDPVTKQGSMQDVVLPGIALYRIEAARTGEYAGKTEPVFGPTIETTLGGVKVSFPEWCSITLYRMVNGQRCEFAAREYWLENYATAGKDSEAPNAMWRKRAFGQLAKCAEAQALRMAFPEATGGEPTAEEMEGKESGPRHVENLAAAAAPAPAPAAKPAEASLWLIDPNAKEHAIGSVELWHRAAMKAIGLLAHDPAALRAWAQENVGTFGAVAERYPDTVKEIRTAISARLFDHEEPTEEETEA
jgi:phage recombination protein Bet